MRRGKVLDRPATERYRPPEAEVVRSMNRIMQPRAVAVIGASDETGKIGNSVMKNLINGGYKGQILPIHPKADEILGYYDEVGQVDWEHAISGAGVLKARHETRLATKLAAKAVPVKEETLTVDAAGPATHELHISKPDGWPAGDYQVEVFLNGASAGVQKFAVK